MNRRLGEFLLLFVMFVVGGGGCDSSGTESARASKHASKLRPIDTIDFELMEGQLREYCDELIEDRVASQRKQEQSPLSVSVDSATGLLTLEGEVSSKDEAEEFERNVRARVVAFLNNPELEGLVTIRTTVTVTPPPQDNPFED